MNPRAIERSPPIWPVSLLATGQRKEFYRSVARTYKELYGNRARWYERTLGGAGWPYYREGAGGVSVLRQSWLQRWGPALRYQALPPRQLVFSLVSASVFLSVFRGTTTRLIPILITRRHHRPTITLHLPVIHPRPRINHPPDIRPRLAMGLRDHRRHRQSPTRRGPDGPTLKVNTAESTSRRRAPVGTPPKDTEPPVEMPTASGGSSIDWPHHEHSGADGVGV